MNVLMEREPVFFLFPLRPFFLFSPILCFSHHCHIFFLLFFEISVYLNSSLHSKILDLSFGGENSIVEFLLDLSFARLEKKLENEEFILIFLLNFWLNCTFGLLCFKMLRFWSPN